MTVAGAALAGSPGEAGQDQSGRWVMLQLTTTVAQVPIIGKVYATATTVSLHDLKHKGNRLHGKGSVCRLDLDSGSPMIQTILPKAFVRSLPAPLVDARLNTKGGRLQFYQPRQTIVVGASLTKAAEPLPASPDDPRVRDQDGDGKPGVTVRIEGFVNGEIYVAQRTWTKLRGSKHADGSFQGQVYFGNEQSILEATSSMLSDPLPNKPAAKRSWFKLARLGAKATCKDALRMSGEWLK
jgi:hypothetical protein